MSSALHPFSLFPLSLYFLKTSLAVNVYICMYSINICLLLTHVIDL